MERKFILTGSVFMMLAVVLGALGAHALKEVLGLEQLNGFETGVRYQVYHALALLLFSKIRLGSKKVDKVIYTGFVVGIILFSFSIYGLVLLPLIGIEANLLGPITPLGGLTLIFTWIFIIFKSFRYKGVEN